MKPTYLTYACMILNVDNVEDIPEDLHRYLSGIAKMVNICGGGLHSRQVVAVAIAAYTLLKESKQ